MKSCRYLWSRPAAEISILDNNGNCSYQQAANTITDEGIELDTEELYSDEGVSGVMDRPSNSTSYYQFRIYVNIGTDQAPQWELVHSAKVRNPDSSSTSGGTTTGGTTTGGTTSGGTTTGGTTTGGSASGNSLTISNPCR